jgi:hypothetical protein
MARRKTGDKGIRVGHLSRVSGRVTIARRNTYQSHIAEPGNGELWLVCSFRTHVKI